jgi:hypothetical protein
MTGIEPALSAWEADVLPLNYIRLTRHFVGSCLAVAPRCASNVPQAWDQRNLRVAHVGCPTGLPWLVQTNPDIVEDFASSTAV